MPTHPSRQLPLPSPITLRHSCSPPSFLRRQESRTTSAHQHPHPPGVPTHPSHQLPLPSPITPPRSCPPSVIPAQAGITNHLCPSTSTPASRPHAPQPPTPSPFPYHPPPVPAPPPSFLRRQEPRTTRLRPLQARNPPTRPPTHKTQAAPPVHHQIHRARHPLERALIGQIDTDPNRSIPCPRDRLLDGR